MLSNINFNLLKTLAVLLEEQHVTRAAERLNLSQAAVSRSLNQLRGIFNDELLVRTKNQMLLTEKAKGLLPQIKNVMQQIHQFLGQEDEFIPSKATNQFNIGMSDYCQLLIVPSLIKILAKHAPLIKVNILNRSFIQNQTELESGQIDLMLGYFQNPPPNIMQKKLFNDSLACIVHDKHPLCRKKLNTKNFFDYQHAVIGYGSAYGESNTIKYLQDLGYDFNPQLTMQTIAAEIIVTCQTDLVMVATQRIAANLSKLLPIKALKYPFPDEEKVVSMYWHRRFNQYKPHQWLRDLIAKSS